LIQVCAALWVPTSTSVSVNLGTNFLGTFFLVANLNASVDVDFGDGSIETYVAVRDHVTGLLSISLFHNYQNTGCFNVSMNATSAVAEQQSSSALDIQVSVVTKSCGQIVFPQGQITEGNVMQVVFIPDIDLSLQANFTASSSYYCNNVLLSADAKVDILGISLLANVIARAGNAYLSVDVNASVNGALSPSICSQASVVPIVIINLAPVVQLTPISIVLLSNTFSVTGTFTDASNTDYNLTMTVNGFLSANTCNVVKVNNNGMYAFNCGFVDSCLLGLFNIAVYAQETGPNGMTGTASQLVLVI